MARLARADNRGALVAHHTSVWVSSTIT
jgi:hypothetical protein